MIIKNIMRLRPVRPRSSSTAGLSDTARRRIDGRQTYDSRIVVFFPEKGGGNVGGQTETVGANRGFFDKIRTAVCGACPRLLHHVGRSSGRNLRRHSFHAPVAGHHEILSWDRFPIYQSNFPSPGGHLKAVNIREKGPELSDRPECSHSSNPSRLLIPSVVSQ